MDCKDRFYPEVKFGGFTDIDGTVAFFSRVNSLLDPSFVVLDLGCGRGACSDDSVLLRKNLRILKGKVAKVIGIDVDESARENQTLDEFRLILSETWPIESNSIDLVVCDNVLEHIENPDQFFLEIGRVLKNGGFLCIRTPNLWSYVALATKLIPNKYHSKITSIVQKSRSHEDVFPTVHRCNSIRRLRSIMKKNMLDCVVYGYEAEPSYLSFSRVAYFIGVIHQRFAPGFLKPAIFAFGQMNKETV
jgi:SAM-dependent methyltransferase